MSVRPAAERSGQRDDESLQARVPQVDLHTASARQLETGAVFFLGDAFALNLALMKWFDVI